ncbi:MAG: hypothetical protein K2L00_01525 [Muribaculaceae bacterium]|nr:hypothetical protein [Muribaculaceae bacterium]
MKAFNSKYILAVGLLTFAVGIPVMKADLLQDGRQAFLNYDFELATELYEKYDKSLRKAPNAAGEKMLDKYRRQLEIAENSLENVQKIEVIDRLDVPLEDFFRYVKLPSTGGRLLDPDASGLKKRGNKSDFAYSSESGDVMMWSESDDNGVEHIMQCERLMDGSWEKPSRVGEILNDGGNARNPFLLTDGITLYYSSDGEGSMGGYDLFVATKDPVSGEFRQPLPVGYPFNSPFNDYMMAIDEDNGIGWWVSDRNGLDGKVSVYVFTTNEVRKNYVLDDEPEIISLARLDDIGMTQDPETDYKTLLRGIDDRASVEKESGSADFVFPLPGGRVARSFSELSSSAARKSMQLYLKGKDENAQLEKKLTNLRKQYYSSHGGASTALKNQILELEKTRDQQISDLKQMRNAVVSAETKH